MKEFAALIFRWLFSKHPSWTKPLDGACSRLCLTMRTTAKCRYNASIRLQRQGRFAFFTTIALSLGLVFIPLMQNAGIKLAFTPGVLNMVQLFFAVASLVYSVVIGTARYDLRAENLNECGDKLKELTRSLENELEVKGKLIGADLQVYEGRYSDIVTDTENHTRSDWRLAALAMPEDYVLTGLPRLWWYVAALSGIAAAYLLPIAMLLIEILLITDMLGATSVLVNYLNGAKVTP